MLENASDDVISFQAAGLSLSLSFPQRSGGVDVAEQSCRNFPSTEQRRAEMSREQNAYGALPCLDYRCT